MKQSSFFQAVPRTLTIGEVTAYLRHKFETDVSLQDIRLEGEISNWKPATSGHIYFVLKDAQASIRCVMWRSQANRLVYQPQFEGEAVVARGRIAIYEAGGNYQFYVEELKPLGQGNLYAQFERLKSRLADEGLFEASLKRPLPPFPQKIGVVTSPTGAAWQDILQILGRRYPIAQIMLAPTLVQGEAAPSQIIDALQAIVQQQVEVIILARGGGSLEDLWPFNHETVARAIAACPVPIITGIGHEVDFTIADFVADMRAPTPSAAAELVAPDKFELRQKLARQRLILDERICAEINRQRANLHQQQRILHQLSPDHLINNYRQRLDDLLNRSVRAIQFSFAQQRTRVSHLTAQLRVLNPERILLQGYAIVQAGPTIITQTQQVKAGDELLIKLSDGTINVKVLENL